MREQIARLRRTARKRKIANLALATVCASVMVICYGAGLYTTWTLVSLAVAAGAGYVRFQSLEVEERILGVLERCAAITGPDDIGTYANL